MAYMIPTLISINPIITDITRQASYLLVHTMMAAANESTYFNKERLSIRTILSKYEYNPNDVKTFLSNELSVLFKKYFPNGEIFSSVDYEPVDERKYKLKITISSKNMDTMIPVFNELFLYIDPDLQTAKSVFENTEVIL
jgi:hypothetical protein